MQAGPRGWASRPRSTAACGACCPPAAAPRPTAGWWRWKAWPRTACLRPLCAPAAASPRAPSCFLAGLPLRPSLLLLLPRCGFWGLYCKWCSSMAVSLVLHGLEQLYHWCSVMRPEHQACVCSAAACCCHAAAAGCAGSPRQLHSCRLLSMLGSLQRQHAEERLSDRLRGKRSGAGRGSMKSGLEGTRHLCRSMPGLPCLQ